MDAVLEYLIYGIRSVLAFGLIVGFIAFIHELGHYACAKLVGCRVDEFSLGFGKLLWGRRIGETDYSLRLIPFIAYVRPAGMDPEEEYEPGDEPGERSFHAKGFWAKQLILIGGPLFNFIGTMVILTGLFWMSGVPHSTIEVGTLLDDGRALGAGIKTGDVLLAFGDDEIWNYQEAILYIEERPEQTLQVRLKRPAVPPSQLPEGTEPTYTELTLPVVPAQTAAGGKIGIQAIRHSLSDQRRKLPFGRALHRASVTTMGYVAKIYAMTIGVIIRSFSSMEVPDEVGGPVKIIAVISEQSQTGLENLLFLTASLSMSIGVFNLLPIPALDGGRMVLIFLTALASILGKLTRGEDWGEAELTRRVEEGFNVAGFVFLIFIMLVVTFKDVRDLFGGGDEPPGKPTPPAATAPAEPGATPAP